jgi:type VI protein secretion system component VasK
MERKVESQIFGVIDELEQYISECKPKVFSSTEIYVEKEVIQGFIDELRRKAPEEIARYQKIISNQDSILDNARKMADGLIEKATAQTDEMLSQNEIMKKAYEQADAVTSQTMAEAQQILDNATSEANACRDAAMEYMEDVMKYVEGLLASSSRTVSDQYDSLLNALNSKLQAVKADHDSLKESRSGRDEKPGPSGPSVSTVYPDTNKE